MSIASELSALSGHISDAYDAVGDKGGTIPANKNMANLPGAINSISGGGSASVVNGVIGNFKASSATVDAHTFVELVSSMAKGGYAELSNNNFSYFGVAAFSIDANRVFVTYSIGNYLYGMVCTISGTTITPGASVQLSTMNNSHEYSKSCLIDTDKIFIAHSGTGNYLYGMVCTISGTTITPGASVQLSALSYSNNVKSVVTVEKNKIFISHGGSSYFSGMVCTISGTTITPGAEVRLSNYSGAYIHSSAALVNTDKIFIAYIGNSSYKLYGVICTISGTTITPHTETLLSDENYSGYYNSVVSVGTDKVFISHELSYADAFLGGTVCSISGTTITPGKNTLLSTNMYQGYAYNTAAAALGPDKVFVSYRGGNYRYGIVCSLLDLTVISTTDMQITTNSGSYLANSAVKIDDNRLFVTSATSTSFGANVVSASDITVKRAVDTVGGLTKTACTTSTAGEVWVLGE